MMKPEHEKPPCRQLLEEEEKTDNDDDDDKSVRLTTDGDEDFLMFEGDTGGVDM